VHKPRRLAINPFFSRSSVIRLEPYVQQHIRKLCEKISEYGKQDRVLSLRNAMVAVTIDIVTEYCECLLPVFWFFFGLPLLTRRTAFGKPVNALDIPDFAPNWEQMMNGVTEAVPVAKSFPGIVQFMQALPLEAVRFMDPLMGAFFDYSNVVRAQVRAARGQWDPQTEKAQKDDSAEQRRTIFSELLDSDLPLHEKSEDRLTQEGVGFISAASETTSTVLNTPRAVAMSIYIIRAFVKTREDQAANAAILKRLAEIDKTLLIHDAGLRDIYQKLRPLLAPPPEQLKPEIGFHVKEEAAPYRIRRRTSRPS